MVGKKAIGKYTKKQVKKMADDIFGTDKATKLQQQMQQQRPEEQRQLEKQ